MHLPPRVFRDFSYRNVLYRVCCSEYPTVMDEIVRVRESLEAYIACHPEFLSSLTPLTCSDDAPEEVRRLTRAAQLVGVGPMAGVAGIIAEMGAQAGLGKGASEAIIDNGGDVYAVLREPLVLGFFGGNAHVARNLAFRIEPDQTPLAICSSSGRMGHSLSLGSCDLATAVSRDAALADAAATQAANLVWTADDIENALARISDVDGVDGVLIIQDGKVGMKGRLPELVRCV